MQLRLGIGIPAYGGKVSFEHTRVFLDLGHTLAASEQRFRLVMQSLRDVCGVDRARTDLVDDALSAGCDWLLMMDADTWVDEGYTLLQMISDADRAGAAVAVAAVPRRNTDGRRELMVYDDKHRALVDEQLLSAPADLVPVASAATAVMAIRMSVFKSLDRPWFRFTPARSEDLDFCDRVGAAGGTIVCDRRVLARHQNRPLVLRGLDALAASPAVG